MKYTVLGSASSLPTRDRNHPAGLLVCDGHRMLLDCGEGTTRQLVRLGQGLQGISSIWLSHEHLDHMLGVAGFAWCLDLVSNGHSVPLWANRKTAAQAQRMLSMCPSSSKVEVHVGEGDSFLETNQFTWSTFPLQHSVPSFGLVVQEKPTREFDATRAAELGVPQGPERQRLKNSEPIVLPTGLTISPEDVLGPPKLGRRFVYVADTRMFEDLVDHCRSADLLVCEATYSEQDVKGEALAEKHSHMTVEGAARLASRAGVRHLLLNHLSPRFDAKDLLADAKHIFENVTIAEDLMCVEIPRRGTSAE